MAVVNKSTLDNVLQSVLSVGNKEANMHYPPFVYDSQFNIITSFILSALARSYPFSSEHQDMLEPFLVMKAIPVQSGMVLIPDDCRDVLDIGVNVATDGSECGAIFAESPIQFQQETMKRKCQSRPVIITPSSEWDYKTTSKYKAPTIIDPIGRYVGSKKIQVCPYDIGTVYLLYIRNEKKYRYGYIMQPDDTYIFDLSTSVESEWTSVAFKPLFEGILALYGAYTRDPNIKDWSLILNQRGII